MNEPHPHDDVPAIASAPVEDAHPLRILELLLAGVAAALLVAGLARLGSVDDDGALQIPAPVAVAEDLAPPPSVTPEQQAAAQAGAGCRVLVDGQAMADRDHLDPDDAPPAAALYPLHRPANSGRHFASALAVPDRIPVTPIDERAVLHNMEHGSVVVWFDAAEVDGDAVQEMQTWMRERRALGFESRALGGVFVSASDAIASGQAVAFRAWGVAVDCDRFDRTVADAFLQDHWGSRGAAPEAGLSPFPEGVLLPFAMAAGS